MKKVSTPTGIIIIAIVVILFFGGVFAYQYFTKTQTNFNVQNSNTKTAVQANTNQPIDISDWKTYTNNQYGFVVKYPNDLVFKEVTQGSWWNAEFYNKENKVFLTIDAIKTDNLKSDDITWSTKIEPEELPVEVTAGGIKGNRIETSPANNCYNVMVKNNGTTYLLGDDCLNNQNLFNQIISTFKFTK